MKLHLSNLDELIQRIRNGHSQNYLNEAVASYRTGAYRASLITTWISVCVDIIEKIRELSSGGDAAAKQFETRLDSIDSHDPGSMLSFERDILDIACDELQLISVIEKSHLERLKNDRNVCAHPTFSDDGSQFSPHAELALSYIVQAANYLLIHPPVKGKVVIQRLFDLINEPSFPNDEEKAYTLLSSDNNLGRVRESSVRNLLVILLKRIFKDEDGLSPDSLGKISAALGAISRLYPETYNNVIESKLGPMLSEAPDKLLKRVFPFLVIRNDIWSKIENATKVRIDQLIHSISVDELVSYRVAQLAEINLDIRKTLLSVIDDLGTTDAVNLISSSPSPLFRKKAIDLFSNSLSFDSAEFRGNDIVIPLSKYMNEEEIKAIFKGALENTGSYGINQILNAGSIGSFFSNLYSETKVCEVDHKVVWLEFWGELLAKEFSYFSLKALMEEDGILEQAEPSHADDMPF